MTTTQAQAHLSGPQGDLQADRIDVLLASQSSLVQRLEASVDVKLKVASRTASGAHLTYHADDERYVLTGTATTPVTVVEMSTQTTRTCRETMGKTLTFFRSTDRIVADGNEEMRMRVGPCPQPSSR